MKRRFVFILFAYLLTYMLAGLFACLFACLLICNKTSFADVVLLTAKPSASTVVLPYWQTTKGSERSCGTYPQS